jgi:putative intracellular protease/amidase
MYSKDRSRPVPNQKPNPMKKLFFTFFLAGMMAFPAVNAAKVLVYVKEGSKILEYMLSHEVFQMTDLLRTAGFEVVVATASGNVLKEGTVVLTPNLKLSEVNIDDYAGFIMPCMGIDTVTQAEIDFAKAVAAKGKPLAAQLGSVMVLAKAGLLQGKKYALAMDPSASPDFKDATYSGFGVVQDGMIITSGICPRMAKETGKPDDTAELCSTLVKAIKEMN